MADFLNYDNDKNRWLLLLLVVSRILFVCLSDGQEIKDQNEVFLFVDPEDNGIRSPDVHTINMSWAV